MAFWNQVDIEPKRQFKFKVTFENIVGSNSGGIADSTMLAQTADRPTYTITDTTKVDFLDKSFYYPGKITWNPIKIKFVDGIGTGNSAKAAYDFLTSAGFILPNNVGAGQGNFSTISKASATQKTGNLAVEVLNSSGTKVDSWALNNAWITNIALNNLDYAAEGILTVEFTFRYDWATYS